MKDDDEEDDGRRTREEQTNLYDTVCEGTALNESHLFGRENLISSFYSSFLTILLFSLEAYPVQLCAPKESDQFHRPANDA